MNVGQMSGVVTNNSGNILTTAVTAYNVGANQAATSVNHIPSSNPEEELNEQDSCTEYVF